MDQAQSKRLVEFRATQTSAAIIKALETIAPKLPQPVKIVHPRPTFWATDESETPTISVVFAEFRIVAVTIRGIDMSDPVFVEFSLLMLRATGETITIGYRFLDAKEVPNAV